MEVRKLEKLFYPAIFHNAEEGGFWVTFPDIPECLTEGDNISEAYKMAYEALGLALSERIKNNESLPVPSSPRTIPVNEDEYPILVEFNLFEYNKKFNSKSVKKTLSIPEWMNEKAISMGINFSRVLQEALMEKFDLATH